MGANSRPGGEIGRHAFDGCGGLCADDDHGIESNGCELLIQGRILAERVLHDGSIRPLDLDVLADQQSVIVTGCYQQEPHDLKPQSRARGYERT